MSELLRIDNVHKSFGEEHVLRGISLKLAKGETKVIIGPSGTGKSTLLRCINHLTTPDKGRVWLEEKEISNGKSDLNKVRSNIGFVFQGFNLFPHLNVLNNLTVGPRTVLGVGKQEAEERAKGALDTVGLAEKEKSYPAELSGGQKQRVGIARALVMHPKLILFDEPTSALDPELIGEVLEVMINLAKEGMTSIAVTHEMGFANSVSDEIIFLEGGKIVEDGPPEQFFHNTQEERTQEFLSKITELYGSAEDRGE